MHQRFEARRRVLVRLPRRQKRALRVQHLHRRRRLELIAFFRTPRPIHFALLNSKTLLSFHLHFSEKYECQFFTSSTFF